MERKLPEEWRLAKLSELVSHPNKDIVDGPFGSNLKASEYVDTGIPIIRLQNIGRNSFLHKNLRYITNEKANELKRHNFSSGDIVITKLGSPLGKACLVPPNINWGIIVADVVRLRSNDNLVLKEYLVRAINSDIGIRQFEPLVKGTTRPRVNLGNIRDLIVPVPPLETQRRIVAILEKAEETQRLRAQADELMGRLIQSVFWEMFGDPIENPNGWKIKKLQELINPDRPITYGILKPGPNIQDGIPYVRVVDIKNGQVDVKDMHRTSRPIGQLYKRSTLKPGDLLLSIRGQVGKLAIVPNCLENANITQDTARLAPIESCSVEFLYGCLTSNSMQQLISRNIKGMAVKGINLFDVKNIPVIVPPKSLQLNFSEIFNLVEKNNEDRSKSKQSTNDMFNLLMQKAFTGELVT